MLPSSPVASSQDSGIAILLFVDSQHSKPSRSFSSYHKAAASLRLVITGLIVSCALILFSSPRMLFGQAPNPTWMTANPNSLTLPGYITYCAGNAANLTVDLRYWWNGVFYETGNGVTFGSTGCVANYYNNDAFAGNYTFVAIRNSANGPSGAWTSISTAVTLYPAPPLPSITSFYPDQNPINSGQGTYLNWASANATSAYINGQYVATSGSLWVTPGSTTTYSLMVYNSAGQAARATVTLTVNTLVNNASVVSQFVTTSMTTGNSYTVSVTMQNTGTTTWTSSAGYQLGSQNLPNNTTWGLSQVPLGAFESIPPGGTKTFTFAVTAPSTAGNYNFQWQMEQGVNGWFGGASVNVLIAVNLPPPPPQPTSLSFSPPAMNAGNGSYTLTVGNGANMTIDLQYTWSGNPGGVSTATNWGPLDAAGQRTVTVNHGDAQGTYTYTALKNSLATPWITLPLPPPSFTILPPQPFTNSLSIAPGSITPPTTFTMTAGNAGGLTADTRSTLNSVAQADQLNWPTFSTLADGVTGQATINASTCTATGNYAFTALRNANLPTKSEASWVPQNGLSSVLCPGAPAITSLAPATLPAGVSTAISLAGRNLCGPPTLSSSNSGMTFSNIIALGDYSGGSLTATVTVSSAVLTGSYPFTLTTPCGQTAGALAVVVNNADFVSQSVSAGLNLGLSYAVSITLKNTGTSTWTAADNFQLGAQNPANNTTWGLSRVPLAPGETVAPGAIKTFSFNVTAPTTPGTYNFQWQMLQNGQWFGSPSPNLAVIVVPPPTIVSLTPPSGAQGQHDIAVVITGSNLTGAQLSAPSASGIHISNVQVVNSTQVTAIIDIATAAPVQTNSISLATLGGSTSGNFSVTSANTLGSPVVNSISPTILLVDTTHFSETFVLSGSNLANATVDVDPTFTITSLNHFADTQLHVTITANVGTPVGTYFFTIRTPNFGNTTARFRVVASVSKPAIESFTPMNPAAGAQYFLQITGNNLSGTTIASDNAGVLIILGSTGVLNPSSTNPPLLPQGNPPDFQSMGGLLVIDPSVPVGTAVRITLTNALGESDSVVIHVAPASQALIDANNSKGANPPYTFNTVPLGTVSSMTTDLLVQPPQMMEAVTFETQLKKGNRQNLFFDILSCDATCRLRFPLASVLYGIPFIDCGGKLFDQSCFQRLKKGDFRSIHVGFIGIEAILFADITLMSDGSFCFLIPCHLSFGWALNIVLPNSKTLSYSKTYPLPSFLARTSPLPDCTTSRRDCTDPVRVDFLPRDSHFCAQLTAMQINLLAGVISNVSSTEACAEATAGFTAELYATPSTIDPGNPVTLSWQFAQSQANPITVDHLSITSTQVNPPFNFNCDLNCPLSGSTGDTPPVSTTYTLCASGKISGDPASTCANPSTPVTVNPPWVKITAPDPATFSFVATTVNGINNTLNASVLRQASPTNPIAVTANTNVAGGQINWQVIGDVTSNSETPTQPNPGSSSSFYPAPTHPAYTPGAGLFNVPSPPLKYTVSATVQGAAPGQITLLQQEIRDVIVQEYVNHLNMTDPQGHKLSASQVQLQSDIVPVHETTNFKAPEINQWHNYGSYNLIIGDPASLAQAVRDEYNNRVYDDVQVVAVGTQVPLPTTVVVSAGHEVNLMGAILDTTPEGDDYIVGNTIVAGPNLIADTHANNNGGLPTNFALLLGSGWRNPERNENVRGVIDSRHQFGNAVDLVVGSVPGKTTFQLYCILETAAQSIVGLTNAFAENGAKKTKCDGTDSLNGAPDHVHVQR